MAGVTGLEPAASGVTGRRSKPTELHPLTGRRAARGDPFLHVRPRIRQVKARARQIARSSVGGDRLELPTSWV